MPSNFPAMTLTAQRLLTAVSVSEGGPKSEVLKSLTRELWESYWYKNIDISTEDVLRQCCSRISGLKDKVDKLMEMAKTAEIKQMLQKKTESCVERGAFGAPILFVTSPGSSTPEMYFGSDRFHLIFKQLSLEWKEPKSKL